MSVTLVPNSRCPFLLLPREIRLLVYDFCRVERTLIVTGTASKEPRFDYVEPSYQKLLQINRQIRAEGRLERRRPLCLEFAGRNVFCQFLVLGWSTCPETSWMYMGSDQGLRVSRRALRCVTTIKIAPGTTEVGYLNLEALATRLPNLSKLELDLRDELMWLYSRIPNITRDEILVKEINWRLGTMFGVDVSTLRWYGCWKIVVHAQFMRPADPEDLNIADESCSRVLNVVGSLRSHIYTSS
jgi:hypothetical protein